MDVQRWRDEQRRLRDALRGRRRSPNGRGPIAQEPQRPARPRLVAADLLHTPIAARRRAGAGAVVAAKRLLRRLLAPFVLEPQTRFNEQVVSEIEAMRAEIQATARALHVPLTGQAVAQPRYDALEFADRFRGSSEEIAARRREYAEIFAGCAPVLDAGCGRGELLELLAARGVDAVGVDVDEDMVAHCRRQGLAVECADVLAYLEAQPDGAFGGVFLGHIVERLDSGQLVALLDALARKTRGGAVLVVETINPQSLPVLMRWFWLDPMHVRLVHPETLQYLLAKAGFEIRTVQFRNHVASEELLPTLELAGVPAEQLDAYNDAVGEANARLFGALDYFVVAVG